MEAQPYILVGGKFPIVSVSIRRKKEYSQMRNKNLTSCRRCLPGLLKPGPALPRVRSSESRIAFSCTGRGAARP
jgi:hypothetical protein